MNELNWFVDYMCSDTYISIYLVLGRIINIENIMNDHGNCIFGGHTGQFGHRDKTMILTVKK